MKRRVISLLAVLAVGSFAATASAMCPGHETTSDKKGHAVAKADAKITAQHPCDPSKCKKPCDPAKCKHKGAITVADRNVTPVADKPKNDGRSQPQGESAAESPCRHKSAASAAAKTPCGKKCGKNCMKDCCKKGVKLTSDDAGMIRCPLTGELIPEKDCPLDKRVHSVLAAMPAIKYRVGGEVTCCSKRAQELAKNGGGGIKYVVGDEVVEAEDDAKVMLAGLLDKEIGLLKTMQFAVGEESFLCPMTAKGAAKKSKTKIAYRVGGVDFPDKVEAEKTLKLIKEALGDVKMTYKVGDQSFCCDKMAGMKVKETGKKMMYVVGEEQTPCEKTARLMLTELMIRTIVATAAAALAS